MITIIIVIVLVIVITEATKYELPVMSTEHIEAGAAWAKPCGGSIRVSG